MFPNYFQLQQHSESLATSAFEPMGLNRAKAGASVAPAQEEPRKKKPTDKEFTGLIMSMSRYQTKTAPAVSVATPAYPAQGGFAPPPTTRPAAARRPAQTPQRWGKTAAPARRYPAK